MNDALPKRKRNRLAHYDYRSPGAYFLTLCTKGRENFFWQTEPSPSVGEDIILPQGQSHLTAYGKIVADAIRAIPTHYPYIKLLQYVIMPNHIHMVLLIPYRDHDGSRTIVSASVLTVAGQMKRYVSKKIGHSIWQRSFHDHIIRDKKDYEKISTYIQENPLKWEYDCFYNEIT